MVGSLSDVQEPQRDPVIDEWLSAGRLGERYLEMDQLTGLQLAATSGDAPPPSDELLFRWYRTIALSRRVTDQSELAFITQARAQNWPWQKIADVLGLPDTETAEHRSAVLGAEVDRMHPDRTRQPWFPWNDPRVRQG